MGTKHKYELHRLCSVHNLISLKMCASQHVHDGEEAIQLDSLETIFLTRWLTRLSAVIWNK